ncbi:MAG: shikimate dehydrogenase [Vannielia sp.]|uniref:shikimate dehydrogenase n=1 Tax=Rhodobacterales TaxID=204455 RepID=UPI002094B067|nr:shikimate dehydrogenase [Oceanicola sp. 502str15]MCO6384186.1 shikimate dehydrogenase [Oceanicola sp. 502str15]
MTEKIPLAGVIGSPIAHSRSPALHRHWLDSLGLRGHYVPMDVSHENLAEVLKVLPKLGFVGCNITIPHKVAALNLADAVSDRAALIGSANTLIFRDDGSIYADNTDGYGFIANLKAGAPDWQAQDGPVAIFGAGGACRAVLASLIEAGCTDIRLANRSRPRAEALRTEFGPKITVYDWVLAGSMIEGAALIVNTTSLGMVGKSEFKVPLDALTPDMVVTDIVYTPLDTELLKTAAAKGCTTVDGLGMLIHQGAPGFERWFGDRPPVTEKTRAAVMGW